MPCCFHENLREETPRMSTCKCRTSVATPWPAFEAGNENRAATVSRPWRLEGKRAPATFPFGEEQRKARFKVQISSDTSAASTRVTSARTIVERRYHARCVLESGAVCTCACRVAHLRARRPFESLFGSQSSCNASRSSFRINCAVGVVGCEREICLVRERKFEINNENLRFQWKSSCAWQAGFVRETPVLGNVSENPMSCSARSASSRVAAFVMSHVCRVYACCAIFRRRCSTHVAHTLCPSYTCMLLLANHRFRP